MDVINQENIKYLKDAIGKEVDILNKLTETVDENYLKAISLILNCKGKVIISGVGKSGIIGKKIAASLASLGSPSFFVHSGEALHGDLGMITSNDIIILISNSGETDEVLGMIPSLKIIGLPIISITRNKNSSLAKESDLLLIIPVEKEIDDLNLAPTASAIATLALGDAIAVTLAHMKGFTRGNFALSHPKGGLGKQLKAEYLKAIDKLEEVK